MAKVEIKIYGDNLYKALLKKEQVSLLEIIYNNHSELGHNVVRRPAGQCLGNLRYFNLFYDDRSGRWYKKDDKLKVGNYFIITDYWKDRVRCFMIWNYGFGRYFPYNDFVEAMVYDYRRFGRLCKPRSKKAQESEEKCVRFYVRSQIDLMRKNGYQAFRAQFMEEHPEYFIGKERTTFRCLDRTLSRDEKIAACHAHKRDLKNRILDSFADRIAKHPNTVWSWFSHATDKQGKNRMCFSEKSVTFLNRRLRNNGLKELSESYLYKSFRMRLLKRFDGKYNSVRSFLNAVVMSASSSDIIIKAMKKIQSPVVLSIYKKALKLYKKKEKAINAPINKEAPPLPS